MTDHLLATAAAAHLDAGPRGPAPLVAVRLLPCAHPALEALAACLTALQTLVLQAVAVVAAAGPKEAAVPSAAGPALAPGLQPALWPNGAGTRGFLCFGSWAEGGGAFLVSCSTAQNK